MVIIIVPIPANSPLIQIGTRVRGQVQGLIIRVILSVTSGQLYSTKKRQVIVGMEGN